MALKSDTQSTPSRWPDVQGLRLIELGFAPSQILKFKTCEVLSISLGSVYMELCSDFIPQVSGGMDPIIIEESMSWPGHVSYAKQRVIHNPLQHVPLIVY